MQSSGFQVFMNVVNCRKEGTMHTKRDNDSTNPSIITMCCTGGLFILGNLVSGNKLTNPRVFNVIDNGTRIQLSPLPGNPPWINTGSDGFRYHIPSTDTNLLGLYYRVTHPEENVLTVNTPIPDPDSVVKLQ
jgi:hypothetical protein